MRGFGGNFLFIHVHVNENCVSGGKQGIWWSRGENSKHGAIHSNHSTTNSVHTIWTAHERSFHQLNILGTHTLIKNDIGIINQTEGGIGLLVKDQSSSTSIAMLPSPSVAPSTTWLPPSSPMPAPLATPTVLPVIRLRLRTNSLCLTCFFALNKTSLPRAALLAPAYERLVAVDILDRTRGARTAPPLARGIFEPPAVATVGRDDGNFDKVLVEVEVAAARCAPSLAMMREREMRGFRVDGNCPFVVVAVIVAIIVRSVAGGRSGL